MDITVPETSYKNQHVCDASKQWWPLIKQSFTEKLYTIAIILTAWTLDIATADGASLESNNMAINLENQNLNWNPTYFLTSPNTQCFFWFLYSKSLSMLTDRMKWTSPWKATKATSIHLVSPGSWAPWSSMAKNIATTWRVARARNRNEQLERRCQDKR